MRLLQGIGPKTAERLAGLGAATRSAQLQAAPAELLAQRFGERFAGELHARAHFHDESPVEPVRVAKSRSSEVTFPADVADPAALEQALVGHGQRARRGAARARAPRPHDRDQGAPRRLDDGHARAHDRRASPTPARRSPQIALALLRAYAPARPVRLLGVRVASFEDETAHARAARRRRCSSRCRSEKAGVRRAHEGARGPRAHALAQITVTSPAPSASFVA